MEEPGFFCYEEAQPFSSGFTLVVVHLFSTVVEWYRAKYFRRTQRRNKRRNGGVRRSRDRTSRAGILFESKVPKPSPVSNYRNSNSHRRRSEYGGLFFVYGPSSLR